MPLHSVTFGGETCTIIPVAILTSLPSTRRRFLTLASLGGGAALLGLAPRVAHAAGDVDSVVLSCMDYRLMDDVGVYMNGRGLKDNYDHLILAGASLGAVTQQISRIGGRHSSSMSASPSSCTMCIA